MENIVRLLRQVPGVCVYETNCGCIVGFKGQNYLYIFKSDDGLKTSQQHLMEGWTGHIRAVSDIKQILEDMGIE